MKRFTKLNNNLTYVVEEKDLPFAIQTLAQFENMAESLLKEQITIELEMKKLKDENKTSSVKFRELFSKKLTNASMLFLLEKHNINLKK